MTQNDATHFSSMKPTDSAITLFTHNQSTSTKETPTRDSSIKKSTKEKGTSLSLTPSYKPVPFNLRTTLSPTPLPSSPCPSSTKLSHQPPLDHESFIGRSSILNFAFQWTRHYHLSLHTLYSSFRLFDDLPSSFTSTSSTETSIAFPSLFLACFFISIKLNESIPILHMHQAWPSSKLAFHEFKVLKFFSFRVYRRSPFLVLPSTLSSSSSSSSSFSSSSSPPPVEFSSSFATTSTTASSTTYTFVIYLTEYFLLATLCYTTRVPISTLLTWVHKATHFCLQHEQRLHRSTSISIPPYLTPLYQWTETIEKKVPAIYSHYQSSHCCHVALWFKQWCRLYRWW